VEETFFLVLERVIFGELFEALESPIFPEDVDFIDLE